MSLITSCPSCGTMFRVVPDQLKISEGWVRCGHCSEVFDAAAHLSDESILSMLPDARATEPGDLRAQPPAPPPQPAPPVRAPVPTAPVRDEATVPAELATRPAALYTKPSAPAQGTAAASDTSSEPSDFFGDSQALEASPLDAPFVFRRSSISMADVSAEPGRESQMLPEEFEREDEPEPEPVPDVSFVRQGRRRAFWRRPGVRVLLSLLFLVLGAALAVQVAYQDRDRLALAQPALRPALVAMCDVLDCRLGPPRQIESIVIDSSGFNRLRNDTYRLSFTLRNAAGVPVAAPAMELTVTDAQDQTLVRRVLTPAELEAANHAIPASGEWSRSVGVVLTTSGAARVAGYRLLAFYP